jgi:hypothetical protein
MHADARVVMREVQRAELPDHEVDKRLVVAFGRDVAREKLCLAAVVADHADSLFTLGTGRVEVGHHDRRAVPAEPDRAGPPDPACRSRDQPCLALPCIMPTR